MRLVCSSTPRRPIKDQLDVWPASPLVIWQDMHALPPSHMDNVVAMLRRSNRVCEVSIFIHEDWQLEKVLVAMQVPFPELTKMELSPCCGELKLPTIRAIPDSFLGGSAPRLQSFELDGIPFPGLPKLLSSASHLVRLLLSDIPHSGYISPEVIATLLSVLSSLEIFSLQFQSPQSSPDCKNPIVPPLKRSILPALRRFSFEGSTKYLEELVARIDTPRLDYMSTTFFRQIKFDISRLTQFVNRTLTFGAGNKGLEVEFYDRGTGVVISDRSQTLVIQISCREPKLQLSFIKQVFNSSLHHLSKVENLCIFHEYEKLGNIKATRKVNTLWLQLFLPFTAVVNLYLSKDFARGILVSLKKLVGGRITEVLPSLQNILVEGLKESGRFQETIGRFVATQQLSGHPIAISDWDWDEDDW